MTDAGGNDGTWAKQAGRIHELARDRAARTYLLARLTAELNPTELADLIQGALVYRERFGELRDRMGDEAIARRLDDLLHGVSTDTPERGGRKP